MANVGVLKQRNKTHSLYVGNFLYLTSFLVLIIIYLVFTFAVKPDQATLNHYHLTTARYYWLIFPIIVFISLIWAASLYGSLKIKSYANVIKGSPDGQAFNNIAWGLLVLALSSPLVSDFRDLFNVIGQHHSGARPTLTIIINYFDLAMMAVALSLVARGAEKLSVLAGRHFKKWSEDVWVFIFIVFSSIYGYLTVGQSDNPGSRSYFMPHWLVLISIAIPYLFFWYRGLRGAEKIYDYHKNVRGKLYKSALIYLASGIALVIASSVLTRTLTTIPVKLSSLHLTPILLIIYGFLTIMAAGYLLIAIGAKRLRQIEEV